MVVLLFIMYAWRCKCDYSEGLTTPQKTSPRDIINSWNNWSVTRDTVQGVDTYRRTRPSLSGIKGKYDFITYEEPIVVDAEVGPWRFISGPYNGYNTERRTCISESVNGGVSCNQLGLERQVPAPAKSIDGGLSEWKNDGAQSGDLQKQTRTCTNPVPQGNGKPCPDVPLTRFINNNPTNKFNDSGSKGGAKINNNNVLDRGRGLTRQQCADNIYKEWPVDTDGNPVPNDQGQFAIALGSEAGQHSQGVSSISIGYQCGQTNQGDSSVSIGTSCSLYYQGSNCVAIGVNAGGIFGSSMFYFFVNIYFIPHFINI